MNCDKMNSHWSIEETASNEFETLDNSKNTSGAEITKYLSSEIQYKQKKPVVTKPETGSFKNKPGKYSDRGSAAAAADNVKASAAASNEYAAAEPEAAEEAAEVVAEAQVFDESYNNFDTMDELLQGGGELLQGIMQYGFERPSTIQKKALPIIFKGQNAVIQAHSGTGKTGAFGIGVLSKINPKECYPQAMILSNTKGLAEQTAYVVEQLANMMKIKVTLCIGGEGAKSVRENMANALVSHVLVGTPGRLFDLIDRDNQANTKIKFVDRLKIVILDEADMLLKDNFIEQMKNIINNINESTQICAFSATYSAETFTIVEKFMKNPTKLLIPKDNLSLENIIHYTLEIEEDWKYDALEEIYKSVRLCQTVIFVNSLVKAEALATRLRKAGHSVGCIHSKIPDLERTKLLKEYRNMTIRVMIATDIMARGIDIQSVGFVLNYDVPYNADEYIHRAGRSGRSGKLGCSVNFVTPSRADAENMENIKRKYKLDPQPMPSLTAVNKMFGN